MAAVFLAVDETVNAVVYPFILSVILLILGVLGLPLGLFWLARWWWLKKIRKRRRIRRARLNWIQPRCLQNNLSITSAGLRGGVLARLS